MLNKTKASPAIPVKFSLHGNQELAVFASGYPKSGPIACDTAAEINGSEQTVSTGGSSLSYDAKTANTQTSGRPTTRGQEPCRESDPLRVCPRSYRVD